ncbi:histidine kinase dimerization/phospho-acceptor domain-containing protein [Leptolyngbya sp. FACHB-261]|uniref:histidine kinase dimerization/phospho-acceptor domain-containing protein n=1 Tax=Leptolyngbya sp. FACHB-261 TaxID=2692806 RepID=UPI0018EFB00E
MASKGAEQLSNNNAASLASLSHELRTALTSIIGWAQLLRAQRLDEVLKSQALEIIEHNARAHS